ncbi:MAG TPA: hypothetical protein VIG51_08685 [Candidatus Baltobacteraceae bacterium]
MKRRFMSASAAALAAGLIGTVAAAPTSPPKTTKTPAKSHAHKATAGKKQAVSKFRQHQLDQLKVSAPGDEYFGHLKLSYLGINNTFHDQTVRAGAFTTNPGILSQINLADDSLRAWANRYPKDPELARSYFLAIKAYEKVYIKDAQDKAWQYMHVLVSHFPKTYFGKLVQKDLTIGFTEHYFAVAEPCPTPSPSPSPGVRPTPTPSASPTPEPTATPTTAPGQPGVLILTPPCVPPATPTPLPTLAPSPGASGSPGPIPSGAMTPTPIPSGSASPASSASPTPSGSPSPASSSSPPGSPSPSPVPTHHPRR